jgi:Lon protease-like protein
MSSPDHLLLFPLNTLLFPDAMFPLHIFEERNMIMIGHLH